MPFANPKLLQHASRLLSITVMMARRQVQERRMQSANDSNVTSRTGAQNAKHGSGVNLTRNGGGTSGMFGNDTSRMEPLNDLASSIRNFFDTLDSMCSPCMQQLYSMASVCPTGDGDVVDFHDGHYAELCEPGTCKSLLSNLETTCEGLPDAEIHVHNVLKSVDVICNLDDCVQAAVSMPEHCSHSDGAPKTEMACLEACSSSFANVLSRCPEDPQTSPIPDVTLSDYKKIRRAVAESVATCDEASMSTTDGPSTTKIAKTTIAISDLTPSFLLDPSSTTINEETVLSFGGRPLSCLLGWTSLVAGVIGILFV